MSWDRARVDGEPDVRREGTDRAGRDRVGRTRFDLGIGEIRRARLPPLKGRFSNEDPSEYRTR